MKNVEGRKSKKVDYFIIISAFFVLVFMIHRRTSS